MASKHLSEHPREGPGSKWVKAQFFCYPKPVPIWDTPHPSLDPRLERPESPFHKRETLRPSIEAFTTELMEDKKRDPPSLPDNCGHHKQAGSGTSHATTSQHPIIQGLCLSTCETPTKYIPASFSGSSFVLMVSVQFQLLTCIFRSMEWSFPTLESFFRCDIEGLTLGLIQWGLFSWFGL